MSLTSCLPVLDACCAAMDSAEIAVQADIARSVFAQEYGELRYVQSQHAPYAYKLPVELLRSIQDNLIEREITSGPSYRKVIIAGGSKHYSDKNLSDLSPVKLEHLKIGCAAKGESPARTGRHSNGCLICNIP